MDTKLVITNCPNCGAPLQLQAKTCEYCGSANVNFKDNPSPAEPVPDDKKDNKAGDIFGGLMGGLFMGNVVRELTRSLKGPWMPFGPHGKRK